MGKGIKQIEHKQRLGCTDNPRPNIIEQAFIEGRGQWIEEPVVSRWNASSPDVSTALRELDELYEQWCASGPGPFCPFSDPLWLQTCEVLRDAGLPWLNNNLNLPDEIDLSWPFQFKHFEREAVIAKGARVEDRDTSGYICNWSEGNLYAIRALQQELRRQRPSKKALLVASRMDPDIVGAAAQMFGLEVFQFENEWESATTKLKQLTEGERPIIFAATWANDKGQSDDFNAISKLSVLLPLVLHVDASRNFDFVTSLPASVRRQFGIPRLTLLQPCLDEPLLTFEEPTICAATIVAAGMNCTYPPPVVVLKPRNLGNPISPKVQYLKGSDNTLSGSRDAIGPLLIYLQEKRFGVSRLREIYDRCVTSRQCLFDKLNERKVPVRMSPASLDILVYPGQSRASLPIQDLGLVLLDDGGFLLSIQPSVTATHIDVLTETLCGKLFNEDNLRLSRSMLIPDYPIPKDVSNELRLIVDHWHHSARYSGGYCLNQATYSVLGPVIGRFLPVPIPHDWTRLHGTEILEGRKTNFGISDAERKCFAACFTTGSTMGNRIGLHTALTYCPNAFIYFSTATHYSVKKIISDSDLFKGRWTDEERPQCVAVAADGLGRMISEELVKQVAKDKALCESHGQTLEIILFVNIGTTFTGGRDDVLSLRRALLAAGFKVAYIHADGALDFGFSPYPVCLGKPDSMTTNGLPVVQGITLSHHKAFGIMVSGEVICYSPTDQKLATTVSSVEPRVIFETWVFQKMYSPADWFQMNQYCHQNASRLRTGLKAIGLTTRYNEESIITLIKRPPAWIVHRFHLAPEEDWVHYITMPHISPTAVDEFVETLALFERGFATALREVETNLKVVVGQNVRIVRTQCLDLISFSNIFAIFRKVHEQDSQLDDFKRRFSYGATSFAALGLNNEPLVVFLSESMLDKAICSRPILVGSELHSKMDTIQSIFDGALDFLSGSLGLVVVQKRW